MLYKFLHSAMSSFFVLSIDVRVNDKRKAYRRLDRLDGICSKETVNGQQYSQPQEASTIIIIFLSRHVTRHERHPYILLMYMCLTVSIHERRMCTTFPAVCSRGENSPS